MPIVLTKIAKNKYNYKWVSSLQEFMIEKKIKTYPYDYFSPIPFHDKNKQDYMKFLTQNSYAIHHWCHSWGKKGNFWQSIKNTPWAFLPYIYKEQFLNRTKMYLKNKKLFF